VSRAAVIMRQAINLEIGDTADKITRAPKKKRSSVGNPADWG
jgi:hypothetical protein